MISINLKDFNLRKIAKKARFFDLLTLYNYRIFGLKQGSSLGHITIESPEKTYNQTCLRLVALQRFFASYGINILLKIDIERIYGKNYAFRIGLRQDLRKHPLFVACLLKTIIFTLEDKIAIEELENTTLKIKKPINL